MRTVQIDHYGNPDVLKVRDLPDPVAKRGEVVIRMSQAGIIEGLGEDVTGFKIGDRVAYCLVRNSYAELAAVQPAGSR